jgi:hypothetical protein
MPHRDTDAIATRLKRIETELQALRQDLRSIAARSKLALKARKEDRDQGLLAKIRKQLGI